MSAPAAFPGDSKPFYLSKTIIINLLMSVAGLIPGVKDYVAANPETAVTVVAVVNLVLRAVTKGGITIS